MGTDNFRFMHGTELAASKRYRHTVKLGPACYKTTITDEWGRWCGSEWRTKLDFPTCDSFENLENCRDR